MASTNSSADVPISALEYLRTKSCIDFDSLDLQACKALGPFPDCTSNQWEAYTQLSDPKNASVLKEAAVRARQLRGQFQDVSEEQLGVEIGTFLLALRIAPVILGSVHVMCNPFYSWDADKVCATGQRFHAMSHILHPSFDRSRLIMKVPATWEGLQACRRLTEVGIKTLATTLFTMEQAVLAGEAGCVSISPFTHELRAHYDTSFTDKDPILQLNIQTQYYYRQHDIPTKVKACAFMTTAEAIAIAGVDAMTLPAEVIEELSVIMDDRKCFEAKSIISQMETDQQELVTYINDRTKFDRIHLLNKRGKAKTEDAIAIFCIFQAQAESLFKGYWMQPKL